MIDLRKKNYPKHSAGALMTDRVPVVFLNSSFSTVEKYLKNKKEEIESINYIYVVDRHQVLKGAVSIKEIFRQIKSKQVSDCITGNLVTVSPYTDGERAANLALKHNLKSIPVVDKKGKLLGVVLSDTILDIVHREIQEDLSRLAGVKFSKSEHGRNVQTISIVHSVRNRIPWLAIGMFGGFLMSKTISSFENTLAQNIILASFIPLIVYMGSAVQTQIGFFIVRDLAFQPKINFFQYAWRQLKVVFLIGLGISLMVFMSSYFLYQDLLLTIILTIAMFLAILSAIITGVFIPFIFYRLKFDPASASGPIATILQDLASIIIYLLVAKSLL